MMIQGIPSVNTAGDTPTSGGCNLSTRNRSVWADAGTLPRQLARTAKSGARPVTSDQTAIERRERNGRSTEDDRSGIAMSTLEEIHWALVELQGLGYAESFDGKSWKLTQSGVDAARNCLGNLRIADRVLLIMHLRDDNEELDNE